MARNCLGRCPNTIGMDQDIQDLRKKNLELNKENNKLLKKMRRNAFLGGLLKLVWIAVLIGVPVYVYFNFLEPVLGQILDSLQTVQEVGSKIEVLEGQIQEKLRGGMFTDFLNFFKRK